HCASLIFGCMLSCFFFQAEDGIRDGHVTGVQTCALPILGQVDFACIRRLKLRWLGPESELARKRLIAVGVEKIERRISPRPLVRSEERRVGKERRSRRAATRQKKRTRQGQPGAVSDRDLV